MHLVQMAVPPFLTAGTAAEPDMFSSRNLPDRLPAVRAELSGFFWCFLCRDTPSGEAVSAAVRLDGILGKGEGLGNRVIAHSLFSHTEDTGFLFIGHG
jgi:hypothetical protein